MSRIYWAGCVEQGETLSNLQEQQQQVFEVAGEEAMVQFGRKLGAALHDGSVVFLEGDLGAGKTTLTRGILRAMGHEGAVKSPTYTLVEPYSFGDKVLYHFDLYRLADPEELEYMGFRDYLAQGNYCLIEWPERGEGILTAPDLRVMIAVNGAGRRISIAGCSAKGQQTLTALLRDVSG